MEAEAAERLVRAELIEQAIDAACEDFERLGLNLLEIAQVCRSLQDTSIKLMDIQLSEK